MPSNAILQKNVFRDDFNGIFAAMRLCKDICVFLEGKGIGCSVENVGAFEVISTCLESGQTRAVLPVEIKARDISEAEVQQQEMQKTVSVLTIRDGSYPLIITEDRWIVQNDMMKKRLLSHLEIFFPIYARNCEVKRIDKSMAAAFLKANHSYGDAACRYRYGLFVKRHTGHLAATAGSGLYCPGTLVAVATFSNARKWVKGGKIIRSYEWTRYASLPEIRVTGGMGKLLETFIQDVQPDDIMSYADLEWSEGSVYGQLGFTLEGKKGPVTFMVDDEWRRFPVKPGMTTSKGADEKPGMTTSKGADEKPGVRALEVDGAADEDGKASRGIFQNFGSRKYRLKLTEYDQAYDE